MADAFDILGLPARFELDPEGVRAAYLKSVAACHPDLAGGDPERSAAAARRSAELNRAQQDLLDPEARARALLSRLAPDAADGERELPEGFLESILETRMAAQEAIAGGDQNEIERLRAWAAEERGEHIRRVSALFRAMEEGGDGAARARQVRRELNAWRYIERMLEQVAAD